MALNMIATCVIEVLEFVGQYNSRQAAKVKGNQFVKFL
jgi:hypothetical protein